MSEQTMRETAYNMAHNRAHGGDAVALAEQIYADMAKGPAHYQAIVQSNNQVGGLADVEDLLVEAERIFMFQRPDGDWSAVEVPPEPLPESLGAAAKE